MEVPRLGVKSELQLLAYTIGTATLDLRGICYQHHSLRHTRSLTHWTKAGIKPASSQTCCQVLNPLSHNGNSLLYTLKFENHSSRYVLFLPRCITIIQLISRSTREVSASLSRTAQSGLYPTPSLNITIQLPLSKAAHTLKKKETTNESSNFECIAFVYVIGKTNYFYWLSVK